MFTGSVLRLHQDNLLDITVIHGMARRRQRKRAAKTLASAGTRK